MLKLNLKNVIWKESKYYVAQCLNVDVSSFGVTKKEALINLNEALELYFEVFLVIASGAKQFLVGIDNVITLDKL